MTKELYFIQFIGHALRQSDPKVALRQAFEKIRALGRQPEYERGFLQFQRFMAVVRQSSEKSSHEAGDIEGIWGETSESEAPYRSPEIIVERNGKCIDSIPCRRLPVTKEIGNVKPGHYGVRLDTGRVIWQGELTEKELLWAAAFPEQALDLAADTGYAVPRTTREIRLLNGELIIRVFPETESGHLEVKIRGSNLD